MAFAQSQTDMNNQAAQEYDKADKRLNQVYQQILREYKSDKVFLTSLQAAEKAWIAFRDAHVKSHYPQPDPSFYGSVNPLCQANMMTELTNARIKQLEEWTKGTEEGNVCCGSVKIKDSK